MGRLETLAIVAAFLYMSDRRAEQGRAILLGNGEQGDFTIELDELLNDKLLDVATASVAAVLPGMLQFVGTLYERLPLTGRGHQRLYHTGETDFFGSSLQLIQRFGIEVPGCFQSQFLGSKVADSLTVHCKVDRTRAGHNLNTFFLEIVQAFRTDSLYFGYDNVRPVFAHHAFQCFAVQHAEHFALVRHLHSGCSGVRVAGYDILPFTLS